MDMELLMDRKFHFLLKIPQVLLVHFPEQKVMANILQAVEEEEF